MTVLDKHFRLLRAAMVLCPLAFVSACASQSPSADMAGMDAPKGPMPGCGMMVDGKMVYKKLAPGEQCMDMTKPSSMPNGVTMHPYPARP